MSFLPTISMMNDAPFKRKNKNQNVIGSAASSGRSCDEQAVIHELRYSAAVELKQKATQTRSSRRRMNETVSKSRCSQCKKECHGNRVNMPEWNILEILEMTPNKLKA
jgi:hypothetical protein